MMNVFNIEDELGEFDNIYERIRVSAQTTIPSKYWFLAVVDSAEASNLLNF